MKKNLWIALSLSTTILLGSSTILANNNLTLMVNGKEVHADVSPTLENGVTFVPISFIAKELGALVDWKSPDVWITQGNNSIRCTVYDNEASINGKPLALTAAPKLEWGRVLVPLRFVTEALGATVDYDGEKGTINVTKDLEEIISQPEQTRDYSVFLDETSNTYIYTRSYFSETEPRKDEYFIYDPLSEQWGRLAADGWGITDTGNGQYPHVNNQGYLDLSKKIFFKGITFKETPNNKWQYIEKREWSTSTGKSDVGFIREIETGMIKEIFRSNSSPTVYSLSDNTFFIEMSAPHEENPEFIYPDDLFIYNPSNDTMTHIATGHHSYYIPSKNIIMYEKNGKPYEYHLITKQIRSLTESEYQINFDLYYSEQDRDNSSTAPLLPSQAERKQFPTVTIETLSNHVGQITINGKTEQLPFMFQSNHQTYVPVKNLINLTGLQLNTKDATTKEAILGNNNIVLNENNSITFDERLYVNETVLESLGIKATIEFISSIPK
ncbi:MAG: stalk domain-containing protein [Cellulosilyticaceae bacterium]